MLGGDSWIYKYNEKGFIMYLLQLKSFIVLKEGRNQDWHPTTILTFHIMFIILPSFKLIKDFLFLVIGYAFIISAEHNVAIINLLPISNRAVCKRLCLRHAPIQTYCPVPKTQKEYLSCGCGWSIPRSYVDNIF